MAYVTTPAGQVTGIPDANEDPNLPLDLLNMAKAIEKRLMGVYASVADRDTKTSGLAEEGMFAYTRDANRVWYYDGATWVAWPPTISSGTSVPANSAGVNGDVFFKV